MDATSPTRSTDEGKAFKKTAQVVGHPATTDHNINDEYMRDPPRNVQGGADAPRTNLGQKEGAYEVEPTRAGVLGQPGLGRPKKEQLLAEAVQGTSDDETL
ncbi:hypothetical protein JAAARDRAFT_30400 [Jaapia argillacea MUCL 33604]|uniref:Uncharacterized protein n=1 Tax=Jaapia argillacea MUCL 33604 TaxID=933084 RepID=A0A067Q8M6_9AGAM|nr:hypothetical protein JAAARDRAFT_30400 [Jaapia argillacea MUCL 33604]